MPSNFSSDCTTVWTTPLARNAPCFLCNSPTASKQAPTLKWRIQTDKHPWFNPSRTSVCSLALAVATASPFPEVEDCAMILSTAAPTDNPTSLVSRPLLAGLLAAPALEPDPDPTFRPVAPLRSLLTSCTTISHAVRTEAWLINWPSVTAFWWAEREECRHGRSGDGESSIFNQDRCGTSACAVPASRPEGTSACGSTREQKRRVED